MVMAMRHGVLPASLHIDEPTPHVDWDARASTAADRGGGLARAEHPRRAGVSSFGISGTNAHLILEQAPDAVEAAPPVAEADGVGGVVPWVVSARSTEALRGQAAALLDRATTADDATPRRGGLVAGSRPARSSTTEPSSSGENRDELAAGLRALATGAPTPGRRRTRKPLQTARVRRCSCSRGQGSQRPGMGAELYDRFPVFAEAFDDVCALLDPHLEQPLRDVVFSRDPEQARLLDHTTYAQAGLFALQVALARLLAFHGRRARTPSSATPSARSPPPMSPVSSTLPDACHARRRPRHA